MPEVLPANIIAGLPEMTFRGLDPVHCSLVDTDFGHDQAERPYPYVDVAGHDNTGRRSSVIAVRLYFVNTLGKPDVFPATWEDWRAALFDGSAGDLVHPLLGTIKARVMVGKAPLVATVRSGIVVDVTFTETRDDPTDAIEFAGLSLEVLAERVAEECEALGIEYPTGEGDSDLFEDVAALEGAWASLSMSANGLVNQTLGKLDNVFGAMESLTDPTTWPAYDAVVSLYAGILQQARRAERLSPRPTAKVTLQNPDTLDAIAARYGNTDAEIMGLNPALVRSPSVPKGAVVTYYK
jgi:prophage DNA circulation protein